MNDQAIKARTNLCTGSIFAVIISNDIDLSDLDLNLFSGTRFVSATKWYADYSALLRGEQDLGGALAGEVLLFAVLNEADHSTMAAAVAALSLPLVVAENSLSKADVWRISSLLAQRLSQELNYSLQAHRGAAKARQELELAQRNNSDVERFFWELGSPKFLKAFELDPAVYSVTLQSDAAEPTVPGETLVSACLRQRLPVSVRTVFAVDTHIVRIKGQLPVTIRLTIVNGAGTPLAVIDQESREESPAWLRFQLETPLAVDDDDFHFELMTQSDGAAEFSLSDPVPYEEFAVRTADGEKGVAPLAVKVWKALPGSRLPTGIAINEEATMPRQGRSLMMLPNELPAPKLLRINGKDHTNAAVSLWWNENAFLVHPPLAGFTAGIIRGIDVGTFDGVTAFVNNHNGAGPMMKVAIAVVPEGLVRHQTALSHIGNWVTLLPKEWGQAHWASATPMTGKVDIIMAAAVLQENTNEKAWALFRGFMFRPARG